MTIATGINGLHPNASERPLAPFAVSVVTAAGSFTPVQRLSPLEGTRPIMQSHVPTIFNNADEKPTDEQYRELALALLPSREDIAAAATPPPSEWLAEKWN